MWLYALVQATQYVGFVGVPYLATRLKGNGLVRDLGAHDAARATCRSGLAIGVGAPADRRAARVVAVARLIGKDTEDLDERARDLTDRAHGFGLLMLTLVVVFGAPFAEELFFRGLTLRVVRAPAGASLGAGAEFGAVRAPRTSTCSSFPALFVFGLVAGCLAQRTGRLGPSWWTHVGFNATTIAILVLTR